MTKCPKCKKIMYTKELAENLNVCFNRDHHIALTAYKRIEAISDDNYYLQNSIRQSPTFRFSKLFRKN